VRYELGVHNLQKQWIYKKEIKKKERKQDK
jgi:hypothetical protein